MSDIIKARRLLGEALKFGEMDHVSKLRVESALGLMTREPACRRAPARPVRITAEMRCEIYRLANSTNLTLHQISEQVGLHNIGRVSEVLNGKR